MISSENPNVYTMKRLVINEYLTEKKLDPNLKLYTSIISQEFKNLTEDSESMNVKRKSRENSQESQN